MFRNFETNGVMIRRSHPGVAELTCSEGLATAASGPLLSLYPLAYTPIPMLAALVLVSVWRTGTGRGRMFSKSARTGRSRS